MAQVEKILRRVMQGQSDANIAFAGLRNLLLHMGFEERIHGSHHTFRQTGVIEKLNLQRDGKHAKSYQVRQVRNAIIRYGLSIKG